MPYSVDHYSELRASLDEAQATLTRFGDMPIGTPAGHLLQQIDKHLRQARKHVRKLLGDEPQAEPQAEPVAKPAPEPPCKHIAYNMVSCNVARCQACGHEFDPVKL